MPAVGALLGKAAAVGAKTGAKAKLGSAAKGLAKDIALDAGASIAHRVKFKENRIKMLA